MPATYAHYRFGASMLSKMPADISRTAKRHRRIYDVGLHGPDLFFFYKPIRSTKIGRLGNKFHRQTGREFFYRACRNLRIDPSEAGQAYLYGVLCHYALDSHCHPLVERYSGEGIASHSRVEAEFERFLLEKDGKEPPYGMDLTKHMTLIMPECDTVSRFYPGSNGSSIRDSLKGMAKIRKTMELPEGVLRTAVIKTMSAGSAVFRDMVVQPQPDPRCQMLNEPLLDAYRQAGIVFPEMLQQLGAHLTYNAPLGDLFEPIFG